MNTHVYTDASVVEDHTYIGIYCEALNIADTIIIPKAMATHKAERLGVLLGIRATRSIETPHYFTDNLEVYKSLRNKYSVHWTPREYNKHADKLANKVTNKAAIKPDGVRNVAYYLVNNYSITHRKHLCSRILGITSTEIVDIYNTRKGTKLGRRLAKTLLMEQLDKPKRQGVQDLKGISDKEWHNLLNKIKETK